MDCRGAGRNENKKLSIQLVSQQAVRLHTRAIIHQTKGSGVKRATRYFAHRILRKRRQPTETQVTSRQAPTLMGNWGHGSHARSPPPLAHTAVFTCVRVNVKIEHHSRAGAQTLAIGSPGGEINIHADAGASFASLNYIRLHICWWREGSCEEGAAVPDGPHAGAQTERGQGRVWLPHFTSLSRALQQAEAGEDPSDSSSTWATQT